MKNNGKVHDVHSLACKIKVFERPFPGNLKMDYWEFLQYFAEKWELSTKH